MDAVQTAAKDSKYVSVTKESDVSYKIDVKADGKVESGDTSLVTGGTVYDAIKKATSEGTIKTELDKKANLDASNIGTNLKGSDGTTAATDAEKKANLNAWGKALGTGTVTSDSEQLVTGKTMYNELRPENGNYVQQTNTTAANLKALDDAIGKEYGSTNNIAGGDNVKTAIGKLDKAMGQVSSLNDIKGLDNQAIGSDAKPTNVSAAVLAVDGKVGNLVPGKEYNVLDGSKSLADNLTKVDAALGDVNSLYGDTGIKGKGGATVSQNTGLAGVMKAMDGKIGDLDQTKTYNVIDKAASVNDNLTAMDTKMGKLTADGNTIKKADSVAGNLSALDTAMGDVKKLNAIKDKDGNAIGSDDKATNVADAVVAVDGNVGDLEKDGNYIAKGDSLSANLAVVDAKMGKLTEDGDYVKINNDFATNFSALDKGLGKLEKDGNLVKKDNSAAANIAIIDTAIGSKDDYGTGYNISTGDDVSLKKNIGALDAAIGTTADGAFVSSGNSVGQNLNALDKGLSDLGDRVNKVGAGAAALAALHVQDFDPDNKLNFAVGYGHYKNANAGAIGAFYKPNHDTTFSIASTIGNGDNMLNAGISFKIGKSSRVEKTMVAKADYEALQQKVAAQDELLAAQNERLSNQDAQIEELKKQVAALIARG